MTRAIGFLALAMPCAFAAGPACSGDQVAIDFLAGDRALPGDPMVTTSDGRVHVLVSVDGTVHLESGQPGGDWSLEPLAGLSDAGIDHATLTASGDSLHAVWGGEAYSLEPREVFYAARPAGGSWSAPVDLTADLPMELRLTRAAGIAASSTGELALVWSSRPAGAFVVARVAEGRLVGDPELVPVSDEGTCDVISRPAFDARDRLVVAASCTRPAELDTFPPELVGVFVARDSGAGWDVERLPGQDGQPRIALGPGDTVHATSLTSWRCADDYCSVVRVAHVGGTFGDWGDSNGIGSAAFDSAIIAVDAEGGVYVAYRGASEDGDGPPCANDQVGCLVTSADGSSFTAPRELPGEHGLRSTGGTALAPRGSGVVLLDTISDGSTDRLALSSLTR